MRCVEADDSGIERQGESCCHLGPNTHSALLQFRQEQKRTHQTILQELGSGEVVNISLDYDVLAKEECMSILECWISNRRKVAFYRPKSEILLAGRSSADKSSKWLVKACQSRLSKQNRGLNPSTTRSPRHVLLRHPKEGLLLLFAPPSERRLFEFISRNNVSQLAVPVDEAASWEAVPSSQIVSL